MLHDLCRKYGDDVAAVIAERDALRMRLKELEDHDTLASQLDARRSAATAELARLQAGVRAARQAAAPDLAAAIEARLPELANGQGPGGHRGRGS